jgi:hypothetical protein
MCVCIYTHLVVWYLAWATQQARLEALSGMFVYMHICVCVYTYSGMVFGMGSMHA